MPKIKKKLVPATTNNLTTAVVNHINLNGGFAFRVNTQGTYSKAKGQYIKSGAKKGVSDIIAVYHGHAIFIEIKNKLTKDKMSDAQGEFAVSVMNNGCKYCICSGFSKTFADHWNGIKYEINIKTKYFLTNQNQITIL